MLNQVQLSGHLKGDFRYSHSNHEKKFYKATIEVERLSGNKDEVLVVAPEEKLPNLEGNLEKYIKVIGRFSSHNYRGEDGKRHMLLYVHANKIEVCKEPANDENDIWLTGYICKIPVLRKTPVTKRDITEVFLAVNRNYGKSDYLCCIAWRSLAVHICETMQVGSKISFRGRIQSRTYFKKDKNHPQGGERKKLHEISIMTMNQ